MSEQESEQEVMVSWDVEGAIEEVGEVVDLDPNPSLVAVDAVVHALWVVGLNDGDADAGAYVDAALSGDIEIRTGVEELKWKARHYREAMNNPTSWWQQLPTNCRMMLTLYAIRMDEEWKAAKGVQS